MEKLFFPIIFGGALEGRPSFTERAAHVTEDFVKKAGLKTQLIDTRHETDFTHADRRHESKRAQELSETFKKADGYIIVSPEYNHGYPGDLKNVLDSFYEEYEKKPIGIIGVSDGSFGGARMVEQLRLVTITLGMVPLRAVIHFLKVKELFDEKGAFLADEKYQKRFDKFLHELSWFASALKKARG